MLTRKIFHFFVFSALVSSSFLSAQGSSSMGSSTSQGSSTIQSMTPLNPIPPIKQPGQEVKKPPIELPKVRQAPVMPVRATYLHPGIIVYRNGQWEGSDHLLNLTSNIGVYAQILKPANSGLELTEAQVVKVVEDVFKQVNIKPQTLASAGQPPLPAFEVEILAYPIEKGFAVAIEAKLFEAVELHRFNLDEDMAFQAVTWDRKTLQVGPYNKIDEQILKAVQDMALEFTERYKAYQELRKEVTR